ncbi:HAMP domain-containing sensor histidine kinase [uncultured Oscillibacter sp.]|uniref:sensor histidine kinase n=1 Tax=uncultured Oscillibacter sp. TaxID=876091 RepID=UPI00261631F6|nr:HAMP domain-containing sensor histidine kinase [uncultured Oscillibacter sp.]
MTQSVPLREGRTKGGRAKALAGFLAFVLGASLTLSSLVSVANQIAWERDPSPRWTEDWQETDSFRNEVSQYLKEFLTIGAGGKVDLYSYDYWYDMADDILVEAEEAYRAWWDFSGPATEAVAVDRGSAEPALPDSSTPVPAEPETSPDARYQADKNVLYYICSGWGTEQKVYTNALKDGWLDKLMARSVEGYNFYVVFRDNKVTITKDGKNLDVYGDGYYAGGSQWFVPGYDNFPVSEELEDVKVIMAVRQSPIRYYSNDYQTGTTNYYSAFYNIAQRVDESWAFYHAQLFRFLCGMWGLVVWFLLRKSTEPVNRKLAAWTVHVWTEARFLAVLLCALWAFLPGFLDRDACEILYAYGYPWDVGYSFYAWGMAVLRLALANLPALLALFWLCWLIYNDHRYNPKEARRSLLGPFLRGLRARDLKRPVEKRLSRRAALTALAAAVLCGEVVSILINMTLIGYPSWILWTAYLLPVLLMVWAAAALLRRELSLSKDLGRLADQVEAVRAGDLRTPLRLPEDADLRQTAESLNDIQAGMRAALEEQTRSERMKVELVSNVSHDLKTPLTSILSYAGLLRQEEGLPPAAMDYARIIDEKAQRLKGMVEDVFEVSKAAADQLPVHLERLDLNKLLRQTLADMDGPIRGSALTFKVDLPEQAVTITADGRRLYRVFQNLIDNALRYALEGSRVYLSLKTAEGTAEASVRNTSRTELAEGVDFTARFVRGDASRTDGGSGLGLSIAKSFTEACGGSFRVETVADLFTAVVTFPTEEA